MVAGVVGAAAIAAPDTPGGRAIRRLADRLARDVRYAVATAPGILYRLAGRQPNPDVPDDILADRIRSTLGPVLKQLDLPHVHVMVANHVALLHGDVGKAYEADVIEHAVLDIPGVEGIESHLHSGLIRGETRPSLGRSAPPPPSLALQAVLEAAAGAGASEPRLAAHAVLCRFVDRIPQGERAQVLAHLPEDVKELAGPPRRHGAHAERYRSFDDLVAAVRADEAIAPEFAAQLTRSVVATLRSLVPEEADDVSAVLPPGLRDVWQAVPTA
jgi:uncharacterized protein (DUF2267 family)